jgi:hypothetical protein
VAGRYKVRVESLLIQDNNTSFKVVIYLNKGIQGRIAISNEIVTVLEG